jgi:hypothetical protein
MVTVKVRKDDLLDMFMERCKFWSGLDLELFEKMYENYIDGGVFDGMELDIMAIVDNDYVNWTSILEKGVNEDFEEIFDLYKQGEYDISCQTCYSYIEAVSDDEQRILVRH